jgi:DNA-directed RNA polymerase specialized sigma24 family protein
MDNLRGFLYSTTRESDTIARFGPPAWEATRDRLESEGWRTPRRSRNRRPSTPGIAPGLRSQIEVIDPMFATTHWSLIATAAADSPESKAALAQLCEAYWFPVYAYIRRKGHDRAMAEDLTQGFFARLLEKNDLAAADRTRGRFRSFLLAACQHFLANQHDHETARKRGGGQRVLSLDFDSAEGKFTREPAANHDSAERLFERRWAVELLDRALAELRMEYVQTDRGALFDVLKPTLAGDANTGYEAISNQLGLSIGSVKVAVHRLRQRYRDRIRDVIGRTVADPADVDAEIRDLFAALG